MWLIDLLLGQRRVTVAPTQRGIAELDGKILNVLKPGSYRLPKRSVVHLEQLTTEPVATDLARSVLRTRPDLAAEHFEVVDTDSHQIAIIQRDDQRTQVQPASARTVLWKDGGPWHIQVVDVEGEGEVDPALAKMLVAKNLRSLVTTIGVADGYVGLLFIDNERQRFLTSGSYLFWTMGRIISCRTVDTRWQHYDVQGQEILTRDRVTLRVNISARYRVTDPVKAVESPNVSEELHRALQLAFRKTLGAMSLDQLLAEKVAVDEEAAQSVRAHMAEIGVEVGEIAMKDVILPGDMREILNQVVAAQKEAEANVIRRREETNATRSLLNTAKVMTDNPIMLRLKELEALEKIAAEVDQLTITNGTAGLLSDVVNLKESKG